MSFAPSRRGRTNIRLSGVDNGNSWQGTGEDTAGNKITWTATFDKALEEKSDSTKARNELGFSPKKDFCFRSLFYPKYSFSSFKSPTILK